MSNICQLSIVIVNYRTPDLVKDCLATLIMDINNLDTRVVVVDNNSGDDSTATIEEWLKKNDLQKKVTLVCSQVNAGFSGGNNIGIKAVRAEYYLLLNSDTLIRKGAIKSLLDTVKQYPEAGLVSPRLEWSDGTPQVSCFRYLTPFSELIAAAKTGLITRILKKYDVPYPVSSHIIRPEWTSFACVLVQQRVFEDIGLMDNGFFMYFEDVDFCHRARKAGWDIVHNPESHVVHLRGGSSPVKKFTKMRKRLPRYYYESRTRYFNKMYGRSGLLAANLLWYTGRIISKLREILLREERQICDHQWIDIWTNWTNPEKPFKHP